MRFPLLSFGMAIAIWVLFIAIFAAISLRNSQSLPATIEVDASMISADSNLQQNNLQKKNDSKEKAIEENLSNQQNKYEKDSQNQQKQNSSGDKIATVTARPLPEIPEDLRSEAFNSYAIARFYIKANGTFRVELIKPCNNPRLNYLLLQSLHKWQFQPAYLANVPVDSTEDIRVNFRVE